VKLIYIAFPHVGSLVGKGLALSAFVGDDALIVPKNITVKTIIEL